MWLFQLLTFFSGSWEMIGSLILFGGGLVLLFGVPFFSESKLKGMGNRPVSVCIAATFVASIVYLTVMAYADAAPYNKVLVVPDKPMSAEARQGMFLYAERECAYCHNVLGKGGHRTGPDMSNMVKKGRDIQYLSDYIKDPTTIYASSAMPAYDLTPEQLKALSSFLLALDFRDAEPIEKPVSEILETSRAPQASTSAPTASGL
ncbi:c-type cytochrome [uncultured Bilophila sp.]|nr:c-type cytochrome [uncultured Bilophila sp.]